MINYGRRQLRELDAFQDKANWERSSIPGTREGRIMIDVKNLPNEVLDVEKYNLENVLKKRSFLITNDAGQVYTDALHTQSTNTAVKNVLSSLKKHWSIGNQFAILREEGDTSAMSVDQVSSQSNGNGMSVNHNHNGSDSNGNNGNSNGMSVDESELNDLLGKFFFSEL